MLHSGKFTRGAILGLTFTLPGLALCAEGSSTPAVKRIAVVPILNTSGEKALDAVCERAADLLVAGLTGKPGIEVVERRAVAALVEELDFGRTSLVTERAAGTALAKRATATHLVLGSLYRAADAVRVACRLVEVDRFLVERSATWQGAASALDEAAGDRLARELLGLPLPEPENVRKARALYERGGFLFQQEMFKEAIEALEKAVDLVPGDARVHILLARSYAQLRGREETAIKEALKATQLDPASAEAWFQLGAIHLKTERPEGAIAPLRMAAQLAPGDAAAHSLLARALLARQRLNEAVQAAERAVALDEKWADAHNVLGHCRAEQGERAKARTSLERALALAPEDATYAGDLAQWYEVLGELALAVTTWERALALVPPKSERADYIRRHLASLRGRLTPPER